MFIIITVLRLAHRLSEVLAARLFEVLRARIEAIRWRQRILRALDQRRRG